MKILALFLVSVSCWGAARIASVTGDWNNTATWGGAAVPVDGDTVTINNSVTVTIPAGYTATVGLNTGADGTDTPAIQCASTTGTGALVVNGTLVFKGPIRQCSANWNINAGAVVRHGGTADSYTWVIAMANAQANALLLINGTSGSRVTIGKSVGALNFGGFRGNTNTDSGYITGSYFDVSDCGTATTSCMVFRSSTAGRGMTLSSFTMTGSGDINHSSATMTAGAVVSLSNCTITSPLRTDRAYINFLINNSLSGGTRSITDCYMEGRAVMTMGSARSDFTFLRNVFIGTAGSGGNDIPLSFTSTDTTANAAAVAEWRENLVVARVTATAVSGGPTGNLYDSIFLSDLVSTGNVHGMSFRMHDDTLIDGWIFETLSQSDGGDYIQPNHPTASRAHSLTVRNNLHLPTTNGRQGGAFLTMSNTTPTYQTFYVQNNTYVSTDDANSGSVIHGAGVEASSGKAGLVQYTRSNLVWRPSSGIGWIICSDDGNLPSIVAGTYVGANYNWTWNLSGGSGPTGWSGVLGYRDLLTSFDTTPGVNDQSGNPRFVDSSRTFLTWGQSLDAAITTREDIFVKFRDRVPGFTVAAALNWIRRGFLPQNPKAWAAGASGVHVGAVDPKPLQLSGITGVI